MNAAELAVGQELPLLSLDPITRTTLALFAGASGDHNPMHIDLDVARAAGMEDVFAHGMLSFAYLARAVTTWFPQDRLRALSTRFVAVTPVHAQPTVHGTVVATDGASVTVQVSVLIDCGTPTLSGTATVAVPPHTKEDA